MKTLPLFITRLGLYLLAVAVPYFHPAVVVEYDRVSRWVWFILVPAEMALAYGLMGRLKWPAAGPLAGLGAILFSILVVAGWNQEALFVAVAGAIGYVWTYLVFRRTGRGPGLAVLELFAFAYIYYKIIVFSRAADEVSAESAGYTAMVFAIALVAFLLHGVVLYLAAFPVRGTARRRLEAAFFFGGVLPATLVLAFLFPRDFVNHDVVFNFLKEEPPPSPQRIDENWEGGAEGQGGGRQKEERHTRNGLPLGGRGDKYPSQMGDNKGQGQGGGQAGGQQPQGQGQQGGGQNQQGQNQNQGGQGQKQGGQNQQGGQNDQEQGGRLLAQGQGQGQGQNQSQSGNNNNLEGVPSDQWNNQQQGGQGQGGRQHTVMVIHSKTGPIYSADAYWEAFDPDLGFEVDESRLNHLGRIRLLETWREKTPNYDFKRGTYEVYYLSTIKDRVLAYQPVFIEPTVQDVRYKPFNLSYRAKSFISTSGPEDWKQAGDLSAREKRDLEKFLELPLTEEDQRRFAGYLNGLIKDKHGYWERLEAILKGFKNYQYKLGFEEDTRVASLRGFLFNTREGDCTEFAHTAALLGRMSGVPSRVVTGYLASRELQTRAHVRGLNVLRRQIKPLQKFPLEELYLITTSHRHAWAQFYIPRYGWIDFETTAYAKPPKPQFDPNNRDVVIPLIDEEQVKRPPQEFQIPWKLVGKLALILALTIVLGLYSYRYIREAYLGWRSRGEGEASLTALYTLLLMKLAAAGYRLRPPFQTPMEYAREHDDLKGFAALYTMLRYRVHIGPEERMISRRKLQEEYSRLLESSRKPGLGRALGRLFSLRGLYY